MTNDDDDDDELMIDARQCQLEACNKWNGRRVKAAKSPRSTNSLNSEVYQSVSTYDSFSRTGLKPDCRGERLADNKYSTNW